MENDEFEDVLEELYRAGSFDSSGSFSMRADKAREKLARFRLENPYSYVCHLYSFGYMAGARAFGYAIGLRTSVLTFQRAEFDPGILSHPFDYLIISPQNSTEWAAHELALGLHCAQAAGVRRIVVSCGRTRIEVEGEKVVSERLATEEERNLSIVLHHRRGLRALVAGLLFGKPSPERAVLEENVTRPLWFEPIAPGRWIRRREDSFEPPREGLLNGRTERGYVSLGSDEDMGHTSDSDVVLSIRGRRFPLAFKFGRGKVVALHIEDTLPLDISQSAPLRNSLFLRVRRTLMEEVAAIRTRLLLEKPEVLTCRDRRTLVRQVSRSKRTRAELTEAQAVLQLVKFNETRIAALLVMSGSLDEAAGLLREQLERDLPQGLRPARYLDLATVEARQGKQEAFKTWQTGYDLMREQHLDRKGHLVSEALESKLLWSPLLGQDLKAAWKDWELARDLKKHLGPEHPRMAETLERGAYLKWFEGEFEEALKLAERALAIRVAHLGEGNPAIGEALALKALAEKGSGEELAAQTSCRRRLSLMQAVYGEEHPETAASLHLQAWTSGEGRSERASRILEASGVAEPNDGKVVVCFRGWFHSRSPWCCCYPLLSGQQ